MPGSSGHSIAPYSQYYSFPPFCGYISANFLSQNLQKKNIISANFNKNQKNSLQNCKISNSFFLIALSKVIQTDINTLVDFIN